MDVLSVVVEGCRTVLDTWMLAPSQHLSEGDTPRPVDDPRERTIARILEEISEGTKYFV